MSNDIEPRDRATEFRRALVATADLAPYIRPRPSLKLVVAAVAAFALAGALTGGAIATASMPDPPTVAAQADAASGAKSYVRDLDGSLVGTPFVRSATGSTTIDLGPKPADATGLMEGFSCFAPARFSWSLGGKIVGSIDCTPNPGGGASYFDLKNAGSHTLTINALHRGPFSIWISWVHIPTFSPSAAEKLALADHEVSRDEEVAGFDRYQGCMGALGHSVPTTTGAIVPTEGYGSGDGSSTRCYFTQWEAVDIQWQRQLMNTDLGEKAVDACLATQGVTPASTPSARWDQLSQLVGIQTRCPWIG
jgi:hypothetical protein